MHVFVGLKQKNVTNQKYYIEKLLQMTTQFLCEGAN